MTQHKRLYNSAGWKRLRLAQLRGQPLCHFCLSAGKTTAATIVDHVQPHRGNEALFFDEFNLQSLCKACHDSAKQREEKTGVVPGCGLDGWPNDSDHHWW